MEEAKSKFRMLAVTEQLIDYVNNILPDYPKKEVVLKQNIEKNQYELIENLFAYNMNTSKRIKEEYIKDFLIKLAMYDYYIDISYHKKYVSKHKMQCIIRMFMEIRKLAYGVLRGLQNVVSENG